VCHEIAGVEAIFFQQLSKIAPFPAGCLGGARDVSSVLGQQFRQNLALECLNHVFLSLKVAPEANPCGCEEYESANTGMPRSEG
jgi:hypothetical protein